MKKTAVWAGIAATCAIAAIGWVALIQRNPVPSAAEQHARSGSRTIADVWRVPESRSVEQSAANSEHGVIDPATAHEALRDVRLDERGNLVLDHVALEALRTGFSSIEHLDDADLTKLRQMIREGLPPPAGEQAAKLVSEYYRYQVAARAMSANAVGGDLESVEAQFRQLIALRESHFGADAAQALFGDEQAYTRFTIETMKLESDLSLSDEMKDKKHAELLAMLPTRLQPGSAKQQASDSSAEAEWHARMAAFQREREAIVAAGLPEQQTNEQLHQLLHDHFDAEEIEKALRADPSLEHRGP